MKVIYIFERRHGYIHDKEMFQMESFLSKGCDVEVWSAVNWKFQEIPEPGGADRSGRTCYIDDENSLKHEINRVKDENCIFLIYPYHSYDYISYIIRKQIKKAGFHFCNITEPPSLQKNFRIISSYNRYYIIIKELYRTLREIGSVFLKIPLKKLVFRKKEKCNYIITLKNLHARFLGPIKYKSLYNFITMEVMYDSFPNYFEILSKRNILIHASPYDEYLDAKSFPSFCKEEYVLYVDSYAVGHSDYIKRGGIFPVSDPQEHLKRLNVLFDKIEESWGCKIIIAAHPKAEYKGEEFQGREIIYYKTNSLIKDARLVIMEITTCAGNVMMHKKDYLVIYSSEYFSRIPSMKNGYDAYVQWLECKKLDIQDCDQIRQWETYVTPYNKKVGDSYIKRYVISDRGVKDKKMYEAISDILIKNE